MWEAGEEEDDGEEGYVEEGEEEGEEEYYGEEDEEAGYGEENSEADYGESQGEADGSAGWSNGYWQKTANGHAWIVDFPTAPAPAAAAPPTSDVAAVAAVAAQAAVAVLLSDGVAAPSVAGGAPPRVLTDADWQRRHRVLELSEELRDLTGPSPKRARL